MSLLMKHPVYEVWRGNDLSTLIPILVQLDFCPMLVFWGLLTLLLLLNIKKFISTDYFFMTYDPGQLKTLKSFSITQNIYLCIYK